MRKVVLLFGTLALVLFLGDYMYETIEEHRRIVRRHSDGVEAATLPTYRLTGCATQTVYLRTDGQDTASNPALAKQLDLDRIICLGEPENTQDCMAVKGYVSVRKDQAADKQEQLAAIAAQKAALENLAVLPPPKPSRPHKTAAAKKQKSNPPELRSSQD
jgi:hypothetical protein